MSTSVRVTFKWLHIPLTSRQPAVIHHTTGLMSLAMDLKGLCAVYEAIQVRHENVILYLNKKSREELSLRERVSNATRKTQAGSSYAIRSCDR